MSTLNAGRMTIEEWRRLAREHDQLQKENWRKHFKEHPEQLLPGAEIKRAVSLDEVAFIAKLAFGCPDGPDEGEWTELVDH